MKLKRITAALLAGVMCVGLLAGCGSKGDGDEKGSGDKITIRLLARMAGTTARWISTMIFWMNLKRNIRK